MVQILFYANRCVSPSIDPPVHDQVVKMLIALEQHGIL